MLRVPASLCLTLVVLLGSLASHALGQFTPPATQNGTSGVPVAGGVPIPIPQAGTGMPQSQLTPEQLQGVMMLRGLQNRGGGRGQVRTGVPQDIGLGPQQGMMPFDGGGYDQSDTSTRKSASQRRAEARAARDEQKRGGAVDPKDKKAQAEKAKADKKALAAKRLKEAADKKAKAAGKKPVAKKPLAKK